MLERPEDLDSSTSTWLTVREFAALFHVTDRFAYRLIADGDLPAFKLGSKAIRIRRSDAEALLRPVVADDVA